MDFRMERLAQVALLAPSADNSQPWRLTWNGTVLRVGYDQPRCAGKLFQSRSHASLIAAGAVAENLEQTLAAWGLRQRCDWSPLASTEDEYFSLDLRELATPAPQGFDIPAAITTRHTNRFPYRTQPLPPAELEFLTGATSGSVRLVALPAGKRQTALAGLARAASEARFLCHELHDWLMDSLRFGEEEVERGDGLDVATLHLPPGGRHFLRFIRPWPRMQTLNRLGFYKFMAFTETALLRQAPALVCLVGRRGDDTATVAAGQLMQQAWLRLNQAGVAVHPYYVITDQLERLRAGRLTEPTKANIVAMRDSLAKVLNMADDETLHMMLRVGYPRVQHPQKSRRLPLATVLQGIEGD